MSVHTLPLTPCTIPSGSSLLLVNLLLVPTLISCTSRTFPPSIESIAPSASRPIPQNPGSDQSQLSIVSSQPSLANTSESLSLYYDGDLTTYEPVIDAAIGFALSQGIQNPDDLVTFITANLDLAIQPEDIPAGTIEDFINASDPDGDEALATIRDAAVLYAIDQGVSDPEQIEFYCQTDLSLPFTCPIADEIDIPEPACGLPDPGPGIVGTRTAGSCTEVALRNALEDQTNRIEFSCGCDPHTITLTSELEIDRTVEIDGADRITLSGGQTTRILRILPNQELTIRNLALVDANVVEAELIAGAAIRMEGSTRLNVDNVHFDRNIAGWAGGIATGFRSVTTISNSRFTNNEGIAAQSEAGGGAIQARSFSTLTVLNSYFANNRGINGGAINNILADLEVESSVFENNDTLAALESDDPLTFGSGGAIYIDGANQEPGVPSRIIIRNSRFEGNVGVGNGGAIFSQVYHPTSSILLEDSTLINNTVVQNEMDVALGGGFRPALCRLQSCGATVDTPEEDLPPPSPDLAPGLLVIRNVMFACNQAENQGGGIWFGLETPTWMENVTFIYNRALAIENPNPTTLADVPRLCNPDPSAVDPDLLETDQLGGAISLDSTRSQPIEMTHVTLTQNFAGFNAGAIFGGNNLIRVSNAIFDRNEGGRQDLDLFDQVLTVENPPDSGEYVGLLDGGNVFEFPGPPDNGDPRNVTVTPTAQIIDPQLGPFIDNGEAIQPPLPIGNSTVEAAGAGAR